MTLGRIRIHRKRTSELQLLSAMGLAWSLVNQRKTVMLLIVSLRRKAMSISRHSQHSEVIYALISRMTLATLGMGYFCCMQFTACRKREICFIMTPNFAMDMDNVPQSPQPVPKSSKRLTVSSSPVQKTTRMPGHPQTGQPGSLLSSMSCTATPR